MSEKAKECLLPISSPDLVLNIFPPGSGALNNACILGGLGHSRLVCTAVSRQAWYLKC